MSIAANLVSRGAVAVYGLTSSLYLFTRIQHHKGVAQDLNQRLLAEEGKVTNLAQELNQANRKLKEQVDLMCAVSPSWQESTTLADKSQESCSCESSASMLIGTMVGGFIAVTASLLK